MSLHYLRGHIIRIFDDQRLLINLGMEQGLCGNERFAIYEAGEEILDPADQTSLGKIERVKTVVEAVHVQEKMTLVMPVKKESASLSTVLSATLAQVSSAGSSTDQLRDKLPVAAKEISGLPSFNPVIRIGDTVRTVHAIETAGPHPPAPSP